ncbi:MAG: hypothetical protein FJ038_03105 [Chloroflexi bacterium]|nr:hypothetical protein [Chloroflexota bacterium]
MLIAAARRIGPVRLGLGLPVLPFELRVRLAWWAEMRGRRPRTLSEHVRHRMTFDRRPILATCCDKRAAREFVAERVGRDVLPALHAVVADVSELDRRALPREFVLKPSHASGGVIVVSEAAPLDAPQPRPTFSWHWYHVHPDRLDWDAVTATARQWLSRRYGAWTLEWGYLGVPRRLMVKELLDHVPDDIKLLVFDGVPRALFRVSGRGSGDLRTEFFTSDWQSLDLRVNDSRPPDRTLPRPPTLERMLDVGARIGRGLDFIRVDLYDVQGRVVFGELTAYPFGGLPAFQPSSFEAEFGGYWPR